MFAACLRPVFMFKSYPSIYNMSKAPVFIMLSLFFIVIGSCSIQKIISFDSFAQVESFKQPKTTLNLSNNQTTCLSNYETVKEHIFLVESNSTNDSASLFLLFTLVSGLFISFLRNTTKSFKKANPNLLVPSLPLFLRYRTLII